MVKKDNRKKEAETENNQVMTGKEMLESFSFTRTDITSPHLKKRSVWMLQVMRFMRVRGWLTSKWTTLSKNILENNTKMPKVWPNIENELSLSEGITDLYHSAAICKKKFDIFLNKMMKIAKPKITREFNSWNEWKDAMEKAEYSKKTAATADIAALDAVPVAIVYQPLKDKERTAKKAKENYHGHYNQVRDVVRASIICDDDEDIAVVLSTISSMTDSCYIQLDIEEYKRLVLRLGNDNGNESRKTLSPNKS